LWWVLIVGESKPFPQLSTPPLCPFYNQLSIIFG
jgi:hypothetical protein